jgi:hypothetical protein
MNFFRHLLYYVSLSILLIQSLCYESLYPIRNETLAKYEQRRRLLDEKSWKVDLSNMPLHHPKSHNSLMEVNGLKNSEVAVFISSTDTKHGKYIWER